MPRSDKASPTSPSPGNRTGPGSLTPSALRSLAARHGIRPKKSLGQHFLIEPALARRIVEIAGVTSTGHVLEVGAGLGSLTVALAETGAEVVAVELDRRLAPALQEVLSAYPRARVVVADAVRVDWNELLGGPGPWVVAANLPYNVAVTVILNLLDQVPEVTRFLVMVQKEVGERLTAGPGDPQFGAVSLRVAYRAGGSVVRRVSRSVFWPRPNVDSVLVSLIRRPPSVDVDAGALWSVVDASFSQRRKTMRGALMRMGMDSGQAAQTLAECGIAPSARPEQLGLPEFACLAERWRRFRDDPR